MSPNGKDIFAKKKVRKSVGVKKVFSPQPGWGKCWFVLERAVFTFVLDVDSPRVRTFPHNFPGGISGWRLCCLAFPILPVFPILATYHGLGICRKWSIYPFPQKCVATGQTYDQDMPGEWESALKLAKRVRDPQPKLFGAGTLFW